MIGLGLGLDGVAPAKIHTIGVSVGTGPAPEGSNRSEFIGGSDAAGILGLSPWQTRLDVYFGKTGTRPPSSEWVATAKKKIFRRGKRAEPHAIDLAIEDLGLVVTKRSTEAEKNYYRDEEHPFLAAEIDFEWEVTPAIAERYELPEELIGTIQNGEVKSVHPFAAAKFGEAETDEIPIEYGCQAMHGLMITGRQLTMFLVLTGWDDLSVYWIRRDEETIAGMRAAEVRFWNENVLARVPPDPATLPDVENLLRRMGTTFVEATPEQALLVKELAKARADLKKISERVDEIQFQLGTALLGATLVENPEEIGRHSLLLEGKEILRVDFQQQYRLNEDKLKANFPRVAEDCAKVIQFFVYRLPRPKKGDSTGSTKTTTEE